MHELFYQLQKHSLMFVPWHLDQPYQKRFLGGIYVLKLGMMFFQFLEYRSLAPRLHNNIHNVKLAMHHGKSLIVNKHIIYMFFYIFS